jgi:hypothetical protein
MPKHDKLNIEVVVNITSKLVVTRHQVRLRFHTLLLNCWYIPNGMTRMATIISATASETTNAFVTVCKRLCVNTATITSPFPSIVRHGNINRIPDMM